MQELEGNEYLLDIFSKNVWSSNVGVANLGTKTSNS